jgi:hypothetical protein
MPKALLQIGVEWINVPAGEFVHSFGAKNAGTDGTFPRVPTLRANRANFSR